MYKSIENYLWILLIPWIPKSDKIWSSYKIFCIEWLHEKYSCAVGSQFEAIGMLGSKSWRKQTPIFFKNGGLFSPSFLSEHSEGLKLQYNGAWIFHAKYYCKFCLFLPILSLFDTFGGIKKLKKTDPDFSEKMGVCFLQLFYPRHGLVSLCNYFMCKFINFWAP